MKWERKKKEEVIRNNWLKRKKKKINNKLNNKIDLYKMISKVALQYNSYLMLDEILMQLIWSGGFFFFPLGRDFSKLLFLKL